jgi:hypothetical protein
MDIKNHKTLTGMLLESVAARLDAELPKDAYKSVPGAADLTDIDPNYMRKVLNEVFGLCGIGWGYKYDSADMHTEIEERKRSNGQGTRRVYVATLRRLTFWYKLSAADGNVVTCEIDASGGSDNDVEAYAMKGAITNALGHASSNIGFQESVYLGKRSHKTIGKTTASAKTAVPAASKTAAPAPKVSKPAAKQEAPVAPAEEDPASFVIQVGQRAGQKLGDQDHKVIEWYANSMKASSDQQTMLQNAARSLLTARPNGHKPQPVAA